MFFFFSFPMLTSSSSLMPLGGILTGPDAEPLVLAARPRQKLWIADINGDVIKTLIFTVISLILFALSISLYTYVERDLSLSLAVF